MTLTSQKDQLLTAFQEFDAAQQMANRARSDMHCLIATLPDGESPGEIGPSSTVHSSTQTVMQPMTCLVAFRSQTDCRSENRSSCSLLEQSGGNRTDRPVVQQVSPEIDAHEPCAKPAEPPHKPAIEKKSKTTRAKRTSEADIRKAVKLVFDESMTQKEAEISCNLPPGTLSRRKGKQIMDGYRKDWGTPTQLIAQHGVSRKELEKALLYGDTR